MDRVQEILQELGQETKATGNLLELVPSEKLEWRPNPKSMTLGQLALHIASIPGNICTLLTNDAFDAKTAKFDPPQPATKEEILAAFEKSITTAKEILGKWDHAQAASPWKLTKGDVEVFSLPRFGVVRTILLNHLYHHRGQLTVYLRFLGLPLPVTYGRSADVNPFA